MKIEEYNEKNFLLPDGIHSCAMYHAKLYESDASYQFRIHDCYGGICLRGKLETEKDFNDAREKLLTLADAAIMFVQHIDKMRDLNYKKHEQAEEIHH